jgi:hypothetical protein
MVEMSDEIHESDRQKRTLKYLFCQQNQATIRVVLGLKGSLMAFLAMAVVGVVLGLAAVLVHRNTYEYSVRYDNKCRVSASTCVVRVRVGKRLQGTVKLQYVLTRFHQNHRRFGFSKLWEQLQGDYVDFDGMVNAKPYRSKDDSKNPEDWILPAGAFANFVFNDTFSWKDNPSKFNESAIVYDSEIEYQFKPLNERYTTGNRWLDSHPLFPGGQQNPHFITWMRTSAASRVVKDWAICNNCDIDAGTYEIEIQSNYYTESFGGEKWVALSRISALGECSSYLWIAWLTFGVLMLGFSGIALTSHSIRGKRVGGIDVQ